MAQSYYVYLLANLNNTVLYLGRTENLIRRVYEHRSKLVKGFTQKYNVIKLVYFEVYEDKQEAAKREWKMKKWRGEWKDDLIKARNPKWDDLYDDICK